MRDQLGNESIAAKFLKTRFVEEGIQSRYPISYGIGSCEDPPRSSNHARLRNGGDC